MVGKKRDHGGLGKEQGWSTKGKGVVMHRQATAQMTEGGISCIPKSTRSSYF